VSRLRRALGWEVIARRSGGYILAAEGLSVDLADFERRVDEARCAGASSQKIDHQPLMAKLRLDLATVACWRNRPRQARDLAESGLRYLVGSPNAAQLHLKYGRAAVRLGHISSARRAVDEARDARERRNDDDLLQLGGSSASPPQACRVPKVRLCPLTCKFSGLTGGLYAGRSSWRRQGTI
jgi:hypothetical protein